MRAWGILDHTAPTVQDCTLLSSSTDRKTSRAALQLLRGFLSPLFLLCSCFAVLNVCLCVCVCVEGRFIRDASCCFTCTVSFTVRQKGA